MGQNSQQLERLISQAVDRSLLDLREVLIARLTDTVSEMLIPGGICGASTGSGEMPSVTLSPEEESNCDSHGLNGRYVVGLSGRTESRKGNQVLIDCFRVILPDADFRRFLRLVVALFESEDGFVDMNPQGRYAECSVEEALFPEGIDQAVNRLRVRLDPALTGMRAADYVQVQRRRVRLSTHRKYIRYDRSRLLAHPDEVIRKLASRLPVEITPIPVLG